VDVYDGYWSAGTRVLFVCTARDDRGKSRLTIPGTLLFNKTRSNGVWDAGFERLVANTHTALYVVRIVGLRNVRNSEIVGNERTIDRGSCKRRPPSSKRHLKVGPSTRIRSLPVTVGTFRTADGQRSLTEKTPRGGGRPFFGRMVEKTSSPPPSPRIIRRRSDKFDGHYYRTSRLPNETRFCDFATE